MSGKILAGRYELFEKIGEGGMSVVYKAHCRLLNRNVAIKVLKPEYIQDTKFTESFRKEAQSAAGLTHPNIVNIYDVGREGNIYYIVMELIEGRGLNEIIQEEGPLPYTRAIEITKQIASALDFAHNNNIIHRDVKPHNILITSTGIAKIADFGIAKAMTSTTIIEGNDTEGVMGSVHYFSPEQARGGYVDERSDIYSLGIVLYEMLTGRVPFDADNPVSVALMHINDDIVPPSEYKPDIPPGLEQVVMKSTDKLQENRYASAAEMIEALENVENITNIVGSGATATAPAANMYSEPENDYYEDGSNSRKKNKKKNSRKKLIAIVALVAITALAAVGYATGLFSGSATAPDLKGLTYEQAQTKAEDAGYNIEKGGDVYDNDVEKGKVASQDPEAGAEAKEGSVITVNISKGPGEATVPSVIGMTKAEAKAKLQASGFELGYSEFVASDKPKGEIVEQDPGAGETAKGGTEVNVKISDGSGEGEVKMPSLVGKTLESAVSALENLKLNKGTVTYDYSNDYSKGQVMWQQYETGTSLKKGNSVNLKVSKGKKNASGEVDLYIDYSAAENEVFYLTVTVTDVNGTRNTISSKQRAKSDGGETVTVKGTGKGTVIVIFDTEEIMRKSINFGTGTVSLNFNKRALFG